MYSVVSGNSNRKFESEIAENALQGLAKFKIPPPLEKAMVYRLIDLFRLRPLGVAF